MAACLQVSAKSYSQRVTLSEKSISIEKALNKIKDQTGCFFFYQHELFKQAGKVNIQLKNATIQQALDALFTEHGLVYSMIDNIIVIKKDPALQNRGEVAENPPPPLLVTGRVLDSDGKPLPGASVRIKGTDKGGTTDDNGHFSLQLTGPGTLVVSFVGFEIMEFRIERSINLGAFSLSPEKSQMSDVVVVGYGTQKKADVTGAMSRFDATVLTERPMARVDQALIGQLAGVRVKQTNSIPGNGLSVQVRGAGSITAGSEPLYVIDGFPLEISATSIVNGRSGTYASGNPLDNINPNDIESIQVLKDASAASIYGSRAANGVVLITTKKGQAGKPVVDFNAYTGWNERSRKMDILSPDEWIEMATEHKNFLYVLRDPGSQNRKATDNYDTRLANIGTFQLATMYDPRWFEPGHPGLTYVDWQDEIFRKGKIQNYQLSAKGGTNAVKYFISGDYFDQDGYILGLGYKRYSARANVEVKPGKRLTAGLNISPSYAMGKNPGVESGIGVESKDGPIFQAVGMIPIIESDIDIRDINVGTRESSKWGYGSNKPSLIRRLEETIDLKKTFRTLATVYASYDIIDNLAIKTTVNFDNTDQTYKFYLPAQLSGNSPANRQAQGSFQSYRKQTFVNENTLSYNKTIAKVHKFNAVIGYSYNENNFENSSIFSTDGFNSASITTLNDASGINNSKTSTYETKNTLISYFGRINYNLDDKYLLAASIRRDGSSKFGSNTKFGVFPSVSAGWWLSKESFMRHVKFISALKLRGSWGVLGNNALGNDYGHISVLSETNYVLGGNFVPGQSPGNYPNRGLSWEQAKTINIGLEYGFVSNRITGSFDYYTKRNTNLLMTIPVPSATGFTTALTNIGEVMNKGWELELSSKNFTGNFKWNTSLNLSFNTNKVKALGPNNAPIYGGDFDLTHNVIMVGQPMYSLYLVQQDGILTQKDIDNGVALYGTQRVGDPKFIDQLTIDTNGDGIPDKADGIINANDRVLSGHPNPDYVWGVTNTFSFKGFDLNILVQGQQGGTIYSTWGRAMDGAGAGQKIGAWRDRWRSPEDPGAGEKGFVYANYGSIKNTNWRYSSDYWRVRNITLGYNLGQWLQKTVISSMRVYVTADNWFGKDKYYGGFNPEAMNNQGDDYGGGPVPRSFLFGFNISFK
ncbi:MAG: hypothetical protein BGP14_12875 [Sphingobacteriales bacterium 44-15]|nr:MAG: hypothetical protein BGP14_12875 [Sphingobacteriales bacterium 44-15]